MRLDGYRARQSLVGLSAHCTNSYIPHVQHIIQYIYACAAGCRKRIVIQCIHKLSIGFPSLSTMNIAGLPYIIKATVRAPGIISEIH